MWLWQRMHLCSLCPQDKMAAGLDPAVVLNFNVGVLGHVDSGKTSLGEGHVTVM